METSRPVVVKRMPEKVNQQEARKFFADVQPFVTADRPQLVFDLSQVKQLDAAGIEMLLRCVEEVMKRDGDLKLASLSRQARMVLELTRTDRLFEIYVNSTEAARSFSGFLPNAMQPIPGYPTRAADPTQLAA
jgi:anti-sigma B factor antagonist